MSHFVKKFIAVNDPRIQTPQAYIAAGGFSVLPCVAFRNIATDIGPAGHIGVETIFWGDQENAGNALTIGWLLTIEFPDNFHYYDAQCTVSEDTGLCIVCGVGHSSECPEMRKERLP